LKASKDALEGLGSERETSDQQVRYLLGVVTAFQEVTALALNTGYGSNEVFDQEPGLRLATLVVNRNDIFAKEMAEWGHEYGFQTTGKGDDQQKLQTPKSEEAQDNESPGRHTSSRKVKMASPVEHILYESVQVSEPQKGDILMWIKEIFHQSRGFEIGTFNHTLLSTIMKKQSSKWECLAKGYISDLIAIVHQFTLHGIRSVCSDEKVFVNLARTLMDDLVKVYKTALDQMDFLLQVERSGTPMTLNHYLNDNLQKW
jgi:hypothetical protein